MLLKKLMDKYKSPEYLVPTPPKNPEEVHQLLGKCKPKASFLSIAPYHGYQHAKALALHSRGPAASPKDSVHIALVTGDSNWGRYIGTSWKVKQLSVKMAHRDITYNFSSSM